MEKHSYDHGVPSWVDIGSPDLEGTAAFYGALFGWDAQEGPPEAGGYRIALLDGKPVAGMGPQMSPDAPPSWLTYVNVDSADATAEAVTAAGGAVFVPPMDVMSAGRMAVFADPTGAVFGVWQPGDHTGAELVDEAGTLCWNELVSTDIDAAATFYAAVFGWGLSKNPPEGEMQYGEWQLGGTSIGGVMPKPEQMPAEVPSYWGVYFAVDDCDAAAAKATELGATLVMPAMDIEPGRFALLTDPVGAMFSVIQLKTPDES